MNHASSESQGFSAEELSLSPSGEILTEFPGLGEQNLLK